MKILFLFCIFLSFIACEGNIAKAYNELDSEFERINDELYKNTEKRKLTEQIDSLQEAIHLMQNQITVLRNNGSTTYLQTLQLTLTYFKQRISFKGTSSTTDADPIVYFNIYFYDLWGSLISTIATADYINTPDLSLWEGAITKNYSIPIGTDYIKICPSVFDNRSTFDVKISSGYCNTKSDIGRLASSEVVYQNSPAYYPDDAYELQWQFQVTK